MPRDTANLGHTVEKIGGTSMSRLPELAETLIVGDRTGEDLYGRIFVVSAFGGVTDALLEHKKSGNAGVYAHFAEGETDAEWSDALTAVGQRMCEINEEMLADPGDLRFANDFVRERIEGARSCLIDLKRLASYGHFRLSRQMLIIRELLAGLGEAHSAFVATLLLGRMGVNARLVDLSGWRDESEHDLDSRIRDGLDDIDVSREIPIVTGYAQTTDGLMREFDRGYSEVTFSRIAAQTGAREAIIHKEFHLSSADPKLVGPENVQKIGHTNFDVADQLSNMGMEAIHPKAAKTLRRAGVSLRVTNAFEPRDPGTLIDERDAEESAAEIVTGLDVYALEVFEPDMLGVKGYDAAILDALTRHNVYIVSKVSNGNTITHYVTGSLKAIRRVEHDIADKYPSAEVSLRALSMASVIGRDLSGLRVMTRGLTALDKADIDCIAMQQNTRRVDVQFLVAREDLGGAIKALHDEIIGTADPVQRKAA